MLEEFGQIIIEEVILNESIIGFIAIIAIITMFIASVCCIIKLIKLTSKYSNENTQKGERL